MGVFGAGRKLFGRRGQQLSFSEVKETLRPAPDADGVTRVFPKELWNDPKIGGFLRELGFDPDAPTNVVPTIDDYRAKFARAKSALDQRVADFNRASEARFGHCRAAPFLIVDGPIWDGPHGSFLFGQLELVAYDEWNILMLALDQETVRRCRLAPYPGPVPALNTKVNETIVRLKAQHEHALEAFGLTATGREGGISREQYEAVRQEIIRDLKEYVTLCKGRMVELFFGSGSPRS